MIVVDLGCYPHGHEVSIERLIERYMPDILYGFDPYPELIEGVTFETIDKHGARHHRVRIELQRKAAWTYDGEIELAVIDGERAWDTTVMREKNSRREWEEGTLTIVPCFDLARFLRELPVGPENLIVKMDVEGAEFPLIEHLVETQTDRCIGRLLVEWHTEKMAAPAELKRRKRVLLSGLKCPIEEWIL